ncbi:MAG: ABC transporter ATP-binding protein [Opitutae bacterium]|nr:ABC transporter ATP-binding protein [Opitutae bacterium]
MDAIVKLEAICKDYGKGPVVVRAIRGISLEIQPGAFVALAGPSGSGKTTLLNLISGLDRPSGGRIWVAGNEVTAMSGAEVSRLRLRQVGFVFQSFSLIPVLTACENAEYVLLLQGVSKAERRERVMAVLRQVGLAGLERRFPRELSGGQQQRVAIARAMVAQPALVLADEPTANLDSRTAAGLLDLMAALNAEQGVTFLFSTHDRNVMKRAHRLIVVRDGRIDPDGIPPEPEGPPPACHGES